MAEPPEVEVIAPLLLAALLQTAPPPTCVPSLDVGILPIRGCWLFSKYADPECAAWPTWEASGDRELAYFTLHPLTQIEGPEAPIANPGTEPGQVTVTVTGSTGFSRTRTFEILPGGACYVVPE